MQVYVQSDSVILSRGDRLAFSTGIITLGVVSAILLVAFRGSIEVLINLYTLGVFTASTPSQNRSLVTAHWWERLLHNQTAFASSSPSTTVRASSPPISPITSSTHDIADGMIQIPKKHYGKRYQCL